MAVDVLQSLEIIEAILKNMQPIEDYGESSKFPVYQKK